MSEPAFIKPTFSINRYDRNGDMFEDGIYLNFNSTTIKITDSIKGFDAFIAHLTTMRQEICDNIKPA